MIALDLFCGGGGACIGMQQAGFEVVGVDIKPHKHYPGHFIQGDIHNLPVNVHDFDFVWASPPCQAFSRGRFCRGKQPNEYDDLIPQTREILKKHPYTCIENVMQAPIRKDIILTGTTVGLPFIVRKRAFEISFWMWQPIILPKTTNLTLCITKSLSANNMGSRKVCGELGLPIRIPVVVAKAVMGIPYHQQMVGEDIGDAVPPAYSKMIADEVMTQLKEKL